MISLKSKEKDFVGNARSDRKPVKFLKNRGNVRSTRNTSLQKIYSFNTLQKIPVLHDSRFSLNYTEYRLCYTMMSHFVLFQLFL